jgi:hypothetical protein
METGKPIVELQLQQKEWLSDSPSTGQLSSPHLATSKRSSRKVRPVQLPKFEPKKDF